MIPDESLSYKLQRIETPATEPALKVGTLTGTVAGLLSIVLYFVPDLLSENRLVTITVVSAFLVPIITAVFTRGQVWSPASVQAVVDEAVSKAVEEITLQKDKEIRGLKFSRTTVSPDPSSDPDIEVFKKEWDK